MLIKLTIIAFLFLQTSQAKFKVHYEWKYINYTWPSAEVYDQAVQNGSYIKEHNAISGIKIWKDRIYLTTPKLKNGVPATLTSIPMNNADNDSPLLSPYPNWQMQDENNCSAFQSVLGMEIDTKGRMWVLNIGRVETRTDNPRTLCRPRLVILDLENNGEVLLDFVFPEDVAHLDSAFLDDIVLDHEDTGLAYITDIDTVDPGIIVFCLKDKSTWKVRDSSMLPIQDARNVTVNGTRYETNSSVNGIALSPASVDHRYVFYCPLSSFTLYSVPAWVLRKNIQNIDPYVTDLGEKPSQTDGMMMSASGNLYFGLLEDDAVGTWNIENPPFNETQRILVQDHELSHYPDGFAIDSSKRLWYVSNNIQNIWTDSLNPEETNFRLIVVQIDAQSYQYRKN